MSDSKKWIEEFQRFVNSSETPSDVVSQDVLSNIYGRLTPSYAKVFSKMLLIHVLSAGVTLLFCPQLGVNSYFGGHGLMALFMSFGPIACAAGCGSVFLGTGLFLIGLLMKPEELRRVKHLRLLNVTVLAALSYAALMLLGAEAESSEYLFWLLGGIFAGRLFLEFGSKLRLHVRFA